MNSYKEMLRTMLDSAPGIDATNAKALFESIVKLNNDTIELGRQRVRDHDMGMSANAILIKMAREMGTRE